MAGLVLSTALDVVERESSAHLVVCEEASLASGAARLQQQLPTNYANTPRLTRHEAIAMAEEEEEVDDVLSYEVRACHCIMLAPA